MIRDGIKDLGKYSYAQKIKEKVRKLFFSFSQMECVILLRLIILNFDEDRVILQNNWIMLLN